jgi:hypothetical protein
MNSFLLLIISNLLKYLAAVYRSEESMIASDMIEMLGKAFKQIRNY